MSQLGVSKIKCARRDKNKHIIVSFVVVNSCKNLHWKLLFCFVFFFFFQIYAYFYTDARTFFETLNSLIALELMASRLQSTGHRTTLIIVSMLLDSTAYDVTNWRTRFRSVHPS